MKLLADEVSVGDRFTKVGDYSRTVYVVDSLTDAHGLFQHARLVCSMGRDRMLISTYALLAELLVTGSRERGERLAASAVLRAHAGRGAVSARAERLHAQLAPPLLDGRSLPQGDRRIRLQFGRRPAGRRTARWLFPYPTPPPAPTVIG
jgi:hypothetical protein